MIARTLGIKSKSAQTPLSFHDAKDIPEWARIELQAAVDAGILTGYPDGTLRPRQMMDRAEMAALIARAMEWDTATIAQTSFADDDVIPDWAKPHIEAALNSGLLQGRGGNLFVADGVTTRAEAAVVLLRIRNHLQ
jgi:hypothetical protein